MATSAKLRNNLQSVEASVYSSVWTRYAASEWWYSHVTEMVPGAAAARRSPLCQQEGARARALKVMITWLLFLKMGTMT